MLWQIQRNFSHSAVVSTSQPWPKSLGKPQKSVIESYPRSRSIDSSKLNHFCFTWKLEYGFVRDFILTFSIFAFPCISSHSDWNEPPNKPLDLLTFHTFQGGPASLPAPKLVLLGVLKWGQMVFLPLPADLDDSNDDEGVLEASGLGIDFCVYSIHRVHLGLSQIRTRNHWGMYPQNLWVFIIFPYLSWYDGHLDPFI